jgi:hypothetical protein
MGFAKKIVIWKFYVKGEQHTVELRHSTLSGVCTRGVYHVVRFPWPSKSNFNLKPTFLLICGTHGPGKRVIIVDGEVMVNQKKVIFGDSEYPLFAGTNFDSRYIKEPDNGPSFLIMSYVPLQTSLLVCSCRNAGVICWLA